MTTDQAPTLVVKEVTRRLGKQDFLAVAGVSFAIYPGQIFSLLGPNGAGKTTTIKMCATMLTPSSGSITVAGIDAVKHPGRARQEIGLVLGGDQGFYPRATAKENLLFFADLAKVGKTRRSAVADALERVNLAAKANLPVQQFSRGMKQRLHLARAILGRPALLLLDEPTNGLDPEASMQVRHLISELTQQGHAILLTSHLLPEVEALASEIALLKQGRIVFHGDLAGLAAYAGLVATSTFTISGDEQLVLAALTDKFAGRMQLTSTPQFHRWQVSIFWQEYQPEDAEQIQAVFTQAGIAFPADYVLRSPTLTESYLSAVAEEQT